MIARTSHHPSTNQHLIRWVEKMADLTQPDAIHWVDGSDAEYNQLCNTLVDAGTFTRLNQTLAWLLLCTHRSQRCGSR